MGRIIIFGCSYTQYGWPTWANILGYDLNKEYHNFALPGLGNVGIMHRMIEADAKLKFTDEDEIFILWSSWSREDRVRDRNWVCAGSVFNAGNPEYNNYYIKRYWHIDNDIVKNASAIIAANKMYGKYIRWQGSAFELGVNEAAITRRNEQTMELFDFYSQQLPFIPSYNFERTDYQKPYKVVQDCHPDIKQHLDILQEFIYPCLGIEIKQSTIDLFTELHNDVEEKVKVTFKPTVEKTIRIYEKIAAYKYQDLFKNRHDYYRIIDD